MYLTLLRRKRRYPAPIVVGETTVSVGGHITVADVRSRATVGLALLDAYSSVVVPPSPRTASVADRRTTATALSPRTATGVAVAERPATRAGTGAD